MEERAADFLYGSVIGLFAWFFGGLDGFLNVLIACIVIDWILGTLNSYIHYGFEKFTVQEFVSVWGRKIGELCFIGLAHLFDKYMLANTAAFKVPVTIFYIVVETKSIIGHVNGLDLPIPKFVQSRLLEIEKKLNDDENLTKGGSISKAIDSNVFRKDEKDGATSPDKNKNDEFSSIYKDIYN